MLLEEKQDSCNDLLLLSDVVAKGGAVDMDMQAAGLGLMAPVVQLSGLVHLLAKKGTSLSDIKEIYSHPQAIAQCSDFLSKLGSHVKITQVENTATAARMVAESDRRDVASLSSRASAAQYSLDVVASAVQNSGNNHTRFICISNSLEIYPGADKTSLMLVTPHKPGALYKMLSRFNALGINLIKLESRPLPDRDFEFMFYFDLESSVYSSKLAELLAELELECDEFTYLGTYSEVI